MSGPPGANGVPVFQRALETSILCCVSTLRTRPVTLPVLGMVGSQVAGFLRAGTGYYAVVGAVVFLLDVVLLRASLKLFDRERLISRWT